MAMQMQSLLANPFVNGSSVTRMSYSVGVLSKTMGRQPGLRVKCMVEEGTEGEPKLNSNSSSPTPIVPPPSAPIPTPKPQPKVSTNFGDVFAFSGPAPERINGRLAMIGFVAAVAVELSNGTDLLDQISNGGSQWFLATSILLSVASLIPIFKGKSVDKVTSGVMNSNAELWNGRVAMLGLVAFAFTEYVKGGALI